MMNYAILAMAIVLVSATAPAFADDAREQEICNISAKTCQNRVDILQRRIRKINAEIRKGSNKYSADEMTKLEQKLKDAMDQLEKVEDNSQNK